MALKLFYDGMSQPSRSVLLLLKCANVKFEPCVTHIAQGRFIDPLTVWTTILVFPLYKLFAKD